MKRSDVRAVPLLPCRSIDEAVDVAVALGFSVTYRQSTPQPYAALRDLDGMEIHYFVVDGLEPAQSYGACLMAVQHPTDVLERWTSGLTDYFGAVPTEGFPRLIAPGGDAEALVGFSFVDAAGNRIRVVRDAEIDDEAEVEEIEVPDEQWELPLHEPAAVEVTDPALVLDDLEEPDPDPEPEPEFDFPAPDPASAVVTLPPPGALEEPEPEPPADTTFERHGVAAAPHHRFAALIYLAELSVRLGRLDDARAHIRGAEAIEPESPALQAVKEALIARETGQDLDG